ncbi:MAG: sigma-70 family RNA polymerase sigma factor [Lachnospiraceae bacterium]|nr:sigma-70 family RNA polymerase sigma factor [Lachnospiraceae bacterium]
MAKYKPLVRGLANEFYIIGGETEDLIQEGMIGLFKAVRDYEKSKEASFSSFANLCVRRQIYTAMEASNRKKHTPLNTYISFSSEEGEDQTVLEEHILNGASASPEQLVIEQEFWEEFYRELWKKLSKMEQQVLTLYREGRTYTEIAEVMHKEPKTIDNALQRIRKKVRLWNSQESARTQFGV